MAKAKIVPLTDPSYAAARAAGKTAKLAPTAVVSASVITGDVRSGPLLFLELRNGALVMIPINQIRELARHPLSKLRRVKVDPIGEGLIWPSLDVGISATGLLEDFFGYATRARIARAGGKRSTPAKAAAARRNGKKGGRRRIRRA